MKTIKILLVDDSSAVLRHMAGLLDSGAKFIIPATGFSEGLDLFHSRQPQAILADFVLEEGHTGLEFLEKIFSSPSLQSGNARPAAALLVLGALSANDQAKAASLGVPIIQKPSRGKEKEFLQNIEFWLHDSKLLG